MWYPSFLVRTGCSVDQSIKENGLGFDDCQSAFACGLVHPGLSSWGILSRPCGTDRGGNTYPGLTSWAILSRPYGTDRGGNLHPGSRRRLCSAVPAGPIGAGSYPQG